MMDVGELLSFEPKKPSLDVVPPTTTKRKRRFEDVPTILDGGPREKKIDQAEKFEKEQILKMLDGEPEPEPLDDTSLKKLLLQFEKRLSRNQELRIKFPDMPEKFLESEVELNDTIQEMHVIATVPELYQTVVDLNSSQSILQLLSHDNTDIAIACIDLLQEMTDVELTEDNEDAINVFIDALLDAQIFALLIQNMDRLDETIKEESDGVHNSLAIVENVTELRPEACVDAGQQGVLLWILKRIKAKMPFDDNKLYCSEILSILLQNHEENRQLLGDHEGIDLLLQQLSMYKRHDPVSAEEIEFMENLFNCVCSALMFIANRDKFLKGEGIQLMNLMLREKKLSRTSALKVLDHAMIGPEGADNCQKFVDILGLGRLFPLFIKSPKAHKKAGPNKRQLEEHIISIVASLVKNCDGIQRQRLINKFVENDHEKVDRLMELHFKYLERVNKVDDKIEQKKRELRRSGSEITDEMEEEHYMSRLDAGLFTLQLIDYIMLDICHSGPSSVRQRVMKILNIRGGSIKAIKSIMREYAGSIGDGKNVESQTRDQERILELVDRF
jgi:beta-catenin-like protein 1